MKNTKKNNSVDFVKSAAKKIEDFLSANNMKFHKKFLVNKTVISYMINLFDKAVYNSKMYVKLNGNMIEMRLSTKNKNITNIMHKISPHVDGINVGSALTGGVSYEYDSETKMKNITSDIFKFMKTYDDTMSHADDENIMAYMEQSKQPKRSVGRPRLSAEVLAQRATEKKSKKSSKKSKNANSSTLNVSALGETQKKSLKMSLTTPSAKLPTAQELLESTEDIEAIDSTPTGIENEEIETENVFGEDLEY